jgi:DNA polymerase III alpha subunit
VYFLLIEDESGLLQCTIFEAVYERHGHILHRSGAFLLEGRVEVDRRRGHSYLVERIADLRETLPGTGMSAPRMVSGSGALLRAGRRSSQAG